MSTQPILLVIGIAIVVNLIIMGGLLVTLIARRRAAYATPDGIVEPASYRFDAMATTPPTATSAISFIDEEADDEDAYERASEDFDEDVSATEPADYRPLRPVMSDSSERTGTTYSSYVSGGSTRTAPAATKPSQPVLGGARPIASSTRPEASLADERLDWEIRLRSEDARLARYRRPVSIVLVELDGMGRLVQRLGADAAERLVPPIRQTLTRQARGADYVARIGPSRFGIILPETDEIQAINYVERVRAECDRWLAAGAVATRLAIGWASPSPGADLPTATRLAEDRLNVDRRRAFVRADYEVEAELSESAAAGSIGPEDTGIAAEIELTPPDGLD
jgi:diguanylate cyclase (GGDEF)-like protein